MIPFQTSSTTLTPQLLQGTVYSIAIRGDDIYTGRQDCKVKKFSSALNEEDSWQLDAATHGRIKAIAFCGDSLAVGTYNNGMLFGNFGEEPEQIIYVSLMTNVYIDNLCMFACCSFVIHEVCSLYSNTWHQCPVLL